MSDPRANLDVEDVLSSIRRLVSQDARAGAKGAPVALDKLVLTPAQRVNDAGQIGPSGGESPARALLEDDDEFASLEETIVELEAAVANIEADFETDETDALADEPRQTAFDAAFEEDAEEAAAGADDKAEAADLADEDDGWIVDSPDTRVEWDEPAAVEATDLAEDADEDLALQGDARLDEVSAETTAEAAVEDDEEATDIAAADATDDTALAAEDDEDLVEMFGDAVEIAPAEPEEEVLAVEETLVLTGVLTEAEESLDDDLAAEAPEDEADADFAALDAQEEPVALREDAAGDVEGLADEDEDTRDARGEAVAEEDGIAEGVLDAAPDDAEDLELAEVEADEPATARAADEDDRGEDAAEAMTGIVEDDDAEDADLAEAVDMDEAETVYDFADAEPVEDDERGFSPGFAQRVSVMEPGEVDNDLLRTMVASLVREELQGALGERLTDRLRKLVRREVQIAIGQRERD